MVRIMTNRLITAFTLSSAFVQLKNITPHQLAPRALLMRGTSTHTILYRIAPHGKPAEVWLNDYSLLKGMRLSTVNRDLIIAPILVD